MNLSSSSPSRGTWIEIWKSSAAMRSPATVVPLAGDVDRNLYALELPGAPRVVPLAGDVDRNRRKDM